MGYYVLKHLQVHSFKLSAKQYVFDLITIMLILAATSFISGTEISWMGWIVLAVKYAVVIAACIVGTNLVFYRKESMLLVEKVLKRKN